MLQTYKNNGLFGEGLMPDTGDPRSTTKTVDGKTYDMLFTGFTGRYCETQLTACSSNPCKNDQPCRLNIDGSFYCECGK